MRFRGILICCALLLALPCWPQAQTESSQSSSTAVRRFVQEFYNWYTPTVLSDHSDPAFVGALRQKTVMFSPELARALREDAEAQARAQGEIVGIDYDPFLFAQDACDRYEAGRIVRKGANYLVDVHGVCEGKKHQVPDAVAELVRTNNSWRFVNFHYPGNGDLLEGLKALRHSRSAPSK